MRKLIFLSLLILIGSIALLQGKQPNSCTSGGTIYWNSIPWYCTGNSNPVVPLVTGQVVHGTMPFDGSNPTTLNTGLSSVTSCTATLVRISGLNTGIAFVTTGAFASGNVDFYAWTKDGIASTGVTSFSYLCWN